MLRYAVVSAACLILHNLIVITASRRGASILQAAGLSFCVMVVIGYLLLSLAVFLVVPTFSGLGRYTAAMAINFPISTGLLWSLMSPLGLPVAIAAPVATVGMVAINFLWARWAVGRGRILPDRQCAS